MSTGNASQNEPDENIGSSVTPMIMFMKVGRAEQDEAASPYVIEIPF